MPKTERQGSPVHSLIHDEDCGRKRKIEGNGIGVDQECNESRFRRKISTRPVFTLEAAKEQAARQLPHHHIEDLMGFDPRSGLLPLSPRYHCGNCSRSDNLKHASMCKGCGQPLKQSIDYGNLTDALVWTYVFRDVGVHIRWAEAEVTLESVVRLLPLARSYLRIDELGLDFFKLQCYFLTHLIYVFSDWGQHTLRRELFSEEFSFIVSNMRLVTEELRDTEIVGEFLQCLRILQFVPEADPELVELVLLGVRFLLAEERERGCKGVWVTKREKGNSGQWGSGEERAYDRYHSSYCGAIALMEYCYVEVRNLSHYKCRN